MAPFISFVVQREWAVAQDVIERAFWMGAEFARAESSYVPNTQPVRCRKGHLRCIQCKGNQFRWEVVNEIVSRKIKRHYIIPFSPCSLHGKVHHFNKLIMFFLCTHLVSN